MNKDNQKNKIPVTLVTGFLGAGKTTLLNHVLKADTGLKFVVIENEFGDIGMDGSFLRPSYVELFELNDGCICCSVRQDLIEVFEQLDAASGKVDHVIIETTGLAEPEPVMRVFDLPKIRNVYDLQGVVTVVDAAHMEESLNDVSTCLEQITFADQLVLNKVDCVDAGRMNQLETYIQSVNPLASVLRATHAQIDVSAFLNVRRESALPPLAVQHTEHSHDHHHDKAIQPVVVELTGDIDITLLDQWLSKLTRNKETPLLRMKGVLAVPGDPRRFLFNGVRAAVEVRPGPRWEDEPRYCRIVMIGRRLNATRLQEEFIQCLPDRRRAG